MENKVKKDFKHDCELLAPAGNMESFIAAINGGADAIYLGLSGFNARGNIENFTKDNLKETVEKAHLFGVKIYLTLNTLVHDDEIEEALDLVRAALDGKVDAFIVQDIGLIHLLRQKFEGIEIHASTQMGLQNLEGVKFVEKLGIKRVVLARETPLNEIKRIKENCNVDIEYFVQGALCVGYSGNCYLCSLLANSSGNRGKCKQFCRLKYKFNGRDEYFLSTKDFCMLPKLKDMLEAGVTSLKIEGRARRPAYVAVAVQTYRKALDDNFNYDNQDIERLKKVFNRGDYIPGYFEDGKVIFSQVQNHIGIKIGKVLDVKKGRRFNEVLLEANHTLQSGDTIKLFDGKNEVMTLSPSDIKKLGDKKYLITTTSDVRKGLEIRLIVDSALEKQALSKKRLLNFDAYMEAKIDSPALLKLSCEGVEVFVQSDEVLTEAKSQPLGLNDCKETLSKGGEEFCLGKLETKLENVFMRKSSLNALRRDGLEKLKAALIKSHEKNVKINEKNIKLNSTKIAPKNDEKIVFFDNLDNIKKIQEKYEKNNKNNIYYVFSPNIFIEDEIIYLAENFREKNVFLDMPLIATYADLLFFKKIFEKYKNFGIYATNYYALNMLEKSKIIIGSELNVFNSYAVDFYLSQGYDKIVLSKENFDFENIKGENAKLFIDTRKPRLIYFKHCPIKEHIGGDCNNCKYREGFEYALGKERLLLKRKKTVACHFYLEGSQSLTRESRFGRVVEE